MDYPVTLGSQIVGYRQSLKVKFIFALRAVSDKLAAALEYCQLLFVSGGGWPFMQPFLRLQTSRMDTAVNKSSFHCCSILATATESVQRSRRVKFVRLMRKILLVTSVRKLSTFNFNIYERSRFVGM